MFEQTFDVVHAVDFKISRPGTFFNSGPGQNLNKKETNQTVSRLDYFFRSNQNINDQNFIAHYLTNPDLHKKCYHSKHMECCRFTLARTITDHTALRIQDWIVTGKTWNKSKLVRTVTSCTCTRLHSHQQNSKRCCRTRHSAKYARLPL